MTLLYLHTIAASHLLTQEFPRKQQVVILGAGISGLGSAQVLHKGAGNFIDVTVVEARVPKFESRIASNIKLMGCLT